MRRRRNLKLIADERLPLRVSASFGGFGRHDGRGWLDFHDGVSNLDANQRLTALEARGDPAWMEGGAYMAFLRLSIDLALWRSLERREQELLIGRDKLSGAAITRVERDGEESRCRSLDRLTTNWRVPPSSPIGAIPRDA